MQRLHFTGPFNKIGNILCIGAHCDDIEIGCGGALLRLLSEAKSKLTCTWVVICSTPVRAKETMASAHSFLAHSKRSNVVIKTYRDGFLPYSGAEVKELFEQLKGEISPDVIFTHHRNDLHQDHRIISELTWNTFRNHLILEYEVPKYDGDLGSPSVFVPLSSRLYDRKVNLILKHYPSQRDKHWLTGDTLRGLARLRGVESGGTERYAEAFYGRKILLG